MSRELPPFKQGHYYHLYNRGAHRRPLFHEHGNYAYVQRHLVRLSAELRIQVIAYCLMPNHYHLLVRQDGEQAAGSLPQRVFNAYSKAHNKRYEHTGTLFEGPYKARHVGNRTYLRQLCCYIHANPVKDGLVEYVDNWPYSNYFEWIGTRSDGLVDEAVVQKLFRQRDEYIAAVRAFLRHRGMVDDLAYLDDL